MPAIILAQALNGIILPVVAIFLLLMVNNAQLLDTKFINTTGYNFLMGVVVFVTILLGVRNVFSALFRMLDTRLLDEQWMIMLAVLISALCCWPLFRKVKLLRSGK